MKLSRLLMAAISMNIAVAFLFNSACGLEFSVTPLPDEFDSPFPQLQLSNTGAVLVADYNGSAHVYYYWEADAGLTLIGNAETYGLDSYEFEILGINNSGQVLGHLATRVAVDTIEQIATDFCQPGHQNEFISEVFAWSPGDALPPTVDFPDQQIHTVGHSRANARLSYGYDDTSRLLVDMQQIVTIPRDDSSCGATDAAVLLTPMLTSGELLVPPSLAPGGDDPWQVRDYNGQQLLWDEHDDGGIWQQFVGGPEIDIVASVTSQIPGVLADDISVRALTRDGRVIGHYSSSDPQVESTAFVWSPDGTIESLPGFFSSEMTINDLGWVHRGRIYVEGQELVPGDLLDAAAAGWGSVSPIGQVNDFGQIVTTASFEGGPPQFVVLTPDLVKYWASAENGSFGDGAKWAGGVAPEAGNVTVFDKPGAFTANFAVDAELADSRVRAGDVTFALAGHVLDVSGVGGLRIGGTDENAVLRLSGGTARVDPLGDGRVEVGTAGTGAAGLVVAEDARLRAAQMKIGTTGTVIGLKELVVGETLLGDPDQIAIKDRVEVFGGGQLSSGQAGIGGSDAANPPTVVLRDAGTRWEIVGLTDTGIDEERLLILGGSGGGSLRVLTGAQAEVNQLLIAALAGTNGTLEISGNGSDDAAAHVTAVLEMSVGRQGVGDVVVESGGHLTANNVLTIGEQLGAIGTVTLRGENTRLDGEALAVGVGVEGLGTLRVEEGAALSGGALVFGDSIGGAGIGHIQGLQTQVVVQEMSVGVLGAATVFVSDGAHVTAEFIDVSVSGGAGGTLKVSSGAAIDGNFLEIGDQGIVILDGGKMTVDGGNILPGGILTGDDGTFESLVANGQLVNAGAILPGNSPGTLTIDANLLQTSSGVLQLEIAGTTPDSEHDQLMVTGDVTLDGNLQLVFIDGFAPQAGQEFALLSVAGDLDIDLADVSVEGLLPGFEFELVGGVDGLVMMALNDGVSVPEPSTWVLLLLSAMGVGLARRRRIA